MSWNYTNKGLSQLSSLGRALVLLGVLMLAFGQWQYIANARLAAMGMAYVPTSRHVEMMMPAALGLAVLAAGVSVVLAARRRERIR